MAIERPTPLPDRCPNCGHSGEWTVYRSGTSTGPPNTVACPECKQQAPSINP